MEKDIKVLLEEAVKMLDSRLEYYVKKQDKVKRIEEFDALFRLKRDVQTALHYVRGAIMHMEV